jgi:hypothetical protein
LPAETTHQRENLADFGWAPRECQACVPGIDEFLVRNGSDHALFQQVFFDLYVMDRSPGECVDLVAIGIDSAYRNFATVGFIAQGIATRRSIFSSNGEGVELAPLQFHVENSLVLHAAQ